ncbi:hypothetical protein ABZ816_13490 [Actinosynnema sp. NPDC047251]|uniref:Uncharacterized protein n=1 Tax=Saccharothrix espanaensis (strain ATCC 51144 / DSM 44229 / JCM 9112 / NBRC 15066 / NRRL 15764) TaxID=1179773 RepID=K0KFT2_SACES|nr:hypothetical protein [Saccharothrix espanaensis]CCH35609.1 hypothetical protein BN6_83940 [Saccharothrix espanaensis DSM 44229]
MVALTSTPDGWTARFGIRITATVDLDRLVGYVGGSAGQRLHRAREEDAAYLARLCTGDPSIVHEVRRRGAEVTLAGTVRRPERERAGEAAEAGLARLLDVPTHVTAEEFEPPVVLAEAVLRKRAVVGVPARPDAGVRYYLAVPPLWSDPATWPGLLGDAELVVELRPHWVRPDFGAMLEGIAVQYERLAAPTVFRTGGLYSAPAALPAEPFAVRAAPLYREAAARYRGWVFRVRIGVTGADPEHLDRLAAALNADHRPPARDLPPALDLVRELADPGEAAHAVWLPAGRVAGLPLVEPPPERTGTHGVIITDSTVRVDGDLFGGHRFGVT